MKKRLLSAALALAMVLTLLPVSAFAAYLEEGTTQPAENGKTTVTYYATANSDQGVKGPGWYWMETIKNADNTTDYKYHKVTTGVINGVGNSGYWYANPVYETSPGSGSYTCLDSFTLLGDISVTSHYLEKNLTVDVNGHTLTMPTDWNKGKVTSFTVYDKQFVQGLSLTQGVVDWASIAKNAADDTQTFNLTIDGAAFANGVSFTNPASHTVTIKNGGRIAQGGVILSGKSDNSQSQSLSVTKGQINGSITVASNNANITVSNLTGATTAPDFTLKGTTTQLNVQGGTVLGAVKLEGVTTGANVTSRPGNVTIDKGCTVASIALNDKTNEKCTGQQTIIINGDVTSGITLTNAAVTVSGGKVGGKIAVDTGTVTVSGDRSVVTGGVELKRDATFNLTGKNCTVGGLVLPADATAATVTFNVNAEPTNTIDSIDANYKKNTVNGGTWKKAVHAEALNTSLIYQLAKGTTGTTYTYYNENQLGEAIMAQSDVATNKLTVVGQATADATQKLSFLNGATVWGYMDVKPGTIIPKLPTSVNNISTPLWTDGHFSPKGGERYTTPEDGDPTELNAGGGAVTGDVTKITKATVKSGANNVYDITATVSSNTISLSGAVPAGQTDFTLILETDAVKKDSSTPPKEIPVVLSLGVKYNPSSKTLTFANTGSQDLGNGVTMENTFDAIKLANGTRYTLNGSRLTVRTATIKVAEETGEIYPVNTYTYIEVNVSASGYTATDTLKQQVIDVINKTGADFDWTKSPAVLQAINAALATITPQQVSQWITTTQQRAWRENDRGTWNNITSPDKTAYKDKVWLVPYLQVNVTDFKPNGSMTATLTPMWRVEVHPESGSLYKVKDKTGEAKDGILIVKSGTALTGISGSLTDDKGAGGVSITLKDGLYSGSAYWAHQDSTTDYRIGTDGKFTVTYAGRSNGLGTFIFNKDKPMITVYEDNTKAKIAGYFSSLQAAVDAAKDKEYILMDMDYSGSTTINMTGKARTIYVQANGKNIVVANASGGLAEYNANGTEYTIKLNRDTQVVQTANITVASVTGGSASVSANPAKVGDTVRITLSPASGYTAAGVTVRTENGQAVTVSGSGTSYTFVMPSGKVTVTPAFNKVQQTNATVTVSNPSIGGTAATSAGNSQVAPGTPVSVTVSPATGYRTMGVYVTNATATRTGANTFSFTVPSGTTNVVVTPRFDRTNGTLFEDVWSYDYFSNAVAWAVGRGVTNGDGSVYRFGTGKSCTREDMVTFLWRNAGSPIVSGVSNPFWDVQVGSYYYNAVMWAIKNGITKGVSTNQFGVGRAVTRGEAVTFLYRAAGEPAASTNSGFYDVPSSEYYAKAVSWAVGKGITNGDGSTVKFSPNGYCLREQIVTFMYRNATGTRA